MLKFVLLFMKAKHPPPFSHCTVHFTTNILSFFMFFLKIIYIFSLGTDWSVVTQAWGPSGLCTWPLAILSFWSGSFDKFTAARTHKFLHHVWIGLCLSDYRFVTASSDEGLALVAGHTHNSSVMPKIMGKCTNLCYLLIALYYYYL